MFRCGEGYVLEACSSSCFVFNKIQKGRQAPGQRVFESRSVLQGHGVSSLGAACFWRSFRPLGPWCFAVSQPPARTWLWSCFEGMGAAPAAPPAAAGAAAAAGPAAAIALFLPESRRDVKPRDSMFLEVVPSFRAMVFCCFATAH